MKKIISKISVLALAGAMMTMAMTGCGENKENSKAEVAETTAITETAETEETAETTAETEETTAPETTETEEVTETTSEDDEWKNSEYYLTGISDIRDNIDNLYAVHLLIGEDTVKAYEKGTFDGITDGYDLMWKFGDEQYYTRDFAKNQNYTVKPLYDCSLEVNVDEIGADFFGDMFWNKTTREVFQNVTKNNKYDPFENGSAEYKENTVCIVWQKEEGTFDGAEAFYYEVEAKNYEYIMEDAFANFEDAHYEYYQHHEVAPNENIADMFTVTGTENTSDEDTTALETTAEAGEEQSEETAVETTEEE